MQPKRNAWLVRRDVGAATIIVQATHIPSMDIWGMTCKVNGELVDHRQSDDPIKEALVMISTAVVNLDALVDMANELVAPLAALVT